MNKDDAKPSRPGANSGSSPADDDATILVNRPAPEKASSPPPIADTADADADATVVADGVQTNPKSVDLAKTTVHRGARLALDDDDATILTGESPENPPTAESAPTKVAPAVSYSTASFLDDDTTVAADLEVGTVLKDRFVIEKILGRGGMGVVYRALDLRKQEAHDRSPYVALKALSDTYQRNEMMVMALQRESQKAQSLAHPNIATVYDFDRQGSLVYLTMEVLTGSPMDDFIRDHPTGIAAERVASIVRGICLGLAYAHNKGIVHSDFKPGNVFLGKNDNPKILDFGIARAAPATETQSRDASDMTQFDAGELGALTPSYAAKEMFFGADPHPSDDVYAVAVTVYQLLTGQHPFQNKPAPQAEAEGLKPAPIPGLKRRQWRAIRHGLAFNRTDRQQHAADFLREFEGQSKLKLVAGIAVFFGMTFAAYFGFVQLQEQARIAPDIPFESLATDVQTKIGDYLNDGQGLEMFQDYAGALTQYRHAYEIHPRNPEAVDNIVTLMQKLKDLAISSKDPSVRANLLENLDDLMSTDGFLSTHESLKTIREELAES
jgi:serine/threonine protein kinase